jgi:hypothetical protein
MGPVTTTVLDDTCRNLIQIAHRGGSRAPPVQTAPGDEAGPSAASAKRGS